MKVSLKAGEPSRIPAFGKSVTWKLLPVLFLAAIVYAAGIWWFMPQVTRQGAVADAVIAAQKTAQQFKILRKYYTVNIIKKALKGEMFRTL